MRRQLIISICLLLPFSTLLLNAQMKAQVYKVVNRFHIEGDGGNPRPRPIIKPDSFTLLDIAPVNQQ